MELTLAVIAQWTGGEILQGSPQSRFHHYNFDSRQTVPGELFFALQGARDGHHFVPDACHKGAGGAVVSQSIDGLPPSFGLVRVRDPLQALHAIARQVLRETATKVVGITGSVGKTTTKEITATMLATRYRVVKSEKNYNNEIGLPLTILQITAEDEVAVLEMAMRGPGDIKRLTEIAPPDVSVLTGIHPVHLEFFPSLEAIAAAKQEILKGTKESGTAVLNGDDPLVMKVASIWQGKRRLFGFSPECETRAVAVEPLGYEGFRVNLQINQTRFEVKFPFLYEAFIYNLLAACSVAHLFSVSGEEMAAAAAGLKPESGRGELTLLNPGVHLVNDTYNSNPRALEEALRSLRKLPARRHLAVLGDMLELGPEAPRFHELSGKKLVDFGWDFLVTVGELSIEIARGAVKSGLNPKNCLSFSSPQEAAAALDEILAPGDLVLVKGSRGMKLEIIVDYLKAKRGGN